MAVTVRMRRVARPYTVHPASAKRAYQMSLFSVSKGDGQVRGADLALWTLQVGAATKPGSGSNWSSAEHGTSF